MLSQANKTRLKAICRQAKLFDGQITLWMLPYTSLHHDQIVLALQKDCPRESWRNLATGEVVFVEPADHKSARLAAERMGAEIAYTGWEHANLWTTVESSFCVLEGYVVDFEVDPTPANPGAKALADYWSQRTGVIGEDYALYTYLAPNDMATEMLLAYNATRAALQKAAPPPEA